MGTRHTLNRTRPIGIDAHGRLRLGVEPRRPDGTTGDVEDLATKWQRLLDLAPGGPDHCCDDADCAEYLDRNAAVNDARARVSQRQEHTVFRSLTSHAHRPSLVARLTRRWGRS